MAYEQPTKYIVNDTNYNQTYETPVLTAGKSFILGYTNETENIFDDLPVIIFDDFTTESKFVDFPFKVKSSAMKILHINQDLVFPKYAFYLMQSTEIDHDNHQRYWISTYSKEIISLPPLSEQIKIIEVVEKIFDLVQSVEVNSQNLKNSILSTKSKILDLAIRGKLVPQDPNDEPASVLLERIRAEKEELIKRGKIKRDKKESVIFKGDDNSYYEKIDGEVSCIDEEIPYNIPDTWTWMRLENCCVKEIRRGKSPKYAEISNVIVFAQKCNTKYNGIDISLAQYLDETIIKRYPTDEHMQDGDIVINSTGTGTLGRVGIYRNTDNTTGLLIVPDSHVTVIRSFSCISSHYLYAFIKAHQSELEKKGEGSTNQKELKPLTLKEMLIAVPPLSEQKRIDKSINVAFSHLAIIEKCLN